MNIFLSLFAVVTVATAASSHHPTTDPSNQAKSFLSRIMRYSQRTRVCNAHVIPYPLNGIRLQQANDDTSKAARTYYDNFSMKLRFVQNNAVSKFQVGIEYKKPMQELSSNKAKIHFFNLLFTASLRVGMRDNHCRGSQLSLLGFVELVKTDVTWHRSNSHVTQHRGKNLAKYDYLQYVLAKSNPQQRTMFANDSIWARTIVMPLRADYIIPLKYESTESIEVDFNLYPDTVEYEKLIEKKVFLVQTNRHNEVIKVISGVDVMVYLKYDTINNTNVPHLKLTNNHSLIHQITNPEKYASVITNLHRRGSESARDTKLMYKEQFHNSADITLNPLPTGMHIYTEYS